MVGPWSKPVEAALRIRIWLLEDCHGVEQRLESCRGSIGTAFLWGVMALDHARIG
jgi:hypothetical protein